MKFLLTLILTACVSFAFGQKMYNAVTTELYKKDYSTGKYELVDKNKNTNITIVSEGYTLTIQALSPTMYKLSEYGSKEIDNQYFYGHTYKARDLKNNLNCDIDIVQHRTSKYLIISVWFDDYNFRYMIEPKE